MSVKKDTKTIYLVKGLGTTNVIFDKLSINGYNPVIVEWEKPHLGEHLEDYAKRLLPQIKEENPTILGLSFGGLVATELAKHFENPNIILLSSIKNKREKPLISAVASLVKADKWFASKYFINMPLWKEWAFGCNKTAEENALIQSMIKQADKEFIDWALYNVLHWENTQTPKKVLHIHGDADNLLPVCHIKDYVCVKGGTHFMVLDKSKEINELLNIYLN